MREITCFFRSNLKSLFPELFLKNLNQLDQVIQVKQLAPVLPILSRKGLTVPFITCEEMLAYNEGKNLELWQLALKYESERGQSVGRGSIGTHEKPCGHHA